MTTLSINGIYAIEAPCPCHIVDLTILDPTIECERLKNIYYSVLVDHRRTQQAPFCVHFLSLADGEILGEDAYERDHSDLWTSDVRVAFLMHFLEPGGSLSTPYGRVAIPPAGALPKRLASIRYESPY